MNRISINIASLYFVAIEPGGTALFIDEDGDEIRIYSSGDDEDTKSAILELARAANAAAGYREGSLVDPRD